MSRGPLVADLARVERILDGLLERLSRSSPDLRGRLPDVRTVTATCPDLALVRHVRWSGSGLELLDHPPDGGADISVTLGSDDLVLLVEGELPFARAYLTGRVRVVASTGDLLRLHAAL